MSLFDEAVTALDYPKVLTGKQKDNILDYFINNFPIMTAGNGKIDWDCILNNSDIRHASELLKLKSIIGQNHCCIIWNDGNLPILVTSLEKLVRAFDDVTAVSFDTWILIPSKNIVIEHSFGVFKINLSTVGRAQRTIN
ncbi:hypothetical protein NGM44_08270 [Moraxella sp. FZFQ2102]|uniref:CDI toxin immunity protein n=1 Tax=Moraxella sp. FZFQ2102 TaxID=2953752 RepID=UPI00209C3905|nr:hypothetical protein [Moraxella sp. FZFQ2102]USZ14359.1 hypothetical protein NGM44_08270 [Moraxella sp. FZFQ2102]